MKLKLVVASMSVLGLISCPALADTAAKHRTHHAKMRHHRMVAQQAPAMAAPCAMPAPAVIDVPRLDTYQLVYDTIGQNLGRQIHGSPDWFNRISLSGGLNFDAHFGNRNMGYMGENYRRLSINDVYVDTSAFVNEWTKAFAEFSFNNASGPNGIKGGQYSTAYPPFFRVQQAYITFSNFCGCDFPFFVQLGKQFTDFGRYTIHPMVRSLTQVMSESLQTSAKLGFITPMGFNGQVYAFENPLNKTNNSFNNSSSRNVVWGAALNFNQPCDQLGYDVGIGWMSNMTGVNDVAAAISNFEGFGLTNAGSYNTRVSAVAVHGDVNSGPFLFGAHYVRALQSFSANNLSTVYNSNLLGLTAGGAKPWAWDVSVGYGFSTDFGCGCRAQTIYAGYQRSGQAVNLLIPRYRWVAGYGIEVLKNTTLGVEWNYDRDYGGTNNNTSNSRGTGKSSQTVNARAAVKFG